MDFRASGNRFIPLLDQIFALLATPFPVPHPPSYQQLLRSYLAFINCYAGHYFLSIYLMNKLEEKKDRILLTFKQAEIGRYTY
jgi:hypothetical protein